MQIKCTELNSPAPTKVRQMLPCLKFFSGSEDLANFKIMFDSELAHGESIACFTVFSVFMTKS